MEETIGMDSKKLHFNRSIIIQPEKGSQYTICSECENLNPLQRKN